MGKYRSTHTGPQIDAGVDAALNPDVAVTPNSDALVTSGAVADALNNIDPTITSDTDTTLNGILVGNGSKVGTKSLDTSTLSNDVNHIPASSVVKSALDAKADQTDLATIHQTSPTCTETNGIAVGVFFYLDNELVVAKTAIANGATFTNGTNYESPTAGGLNALKSALTRMEPIFKYTPTTSTQITLHGWGMWAPVTIDFTVSFESNAYRGTIFILSSGSCTFVGSGTSASWVVSNVSFNTTTGVITITVSQPYSSLLFDQPRSQSGIEYVYITE